VRLKADIRVMSLPRGKDPDEVIHEDLDVWRRCVQNALPLLEYKFEQIVAKHDLGNARSKATLVEELGAELALIPDRLQQAHYIGKLTQHVAGLAGTFQLREGDLHEAVTRARLRKQVAPRLRSDSAPTAGREEHTKVLPLRLDTEDVLLMRALRYLDDVPLWSQNLRTDEVVKSENREVLQFLLNRSDQGPNSSEVPEPVARHMAYLQDLAGREPEISEASRAAEFDRLILKLHEQAAVRKQAERATLLSQTPDGRSRDIEIGALDDLDALHLSKAELGRRTLLTHS